MRDIVSNLAPWIFLFIGVIAIYAWIVAMVSMFRLPDHKLPEVPWKDVPLLGGRRINIIFLPQFLTEEGKRIRRRLVVHALIFVGVTMIPWTIAMVAVYLGFKF